MGYTLCYRSNRSMTVAISFEHIENKSSKEGKMKTKDLLKRISILLIIGAFMLIGCEETDDGKVSAEDSTAAVAQTELANAALEDVMDGMFDADPDSLQDLIDLLDFSEPYGLYTAAHDLDPNNSDANFGLAFTGFLRLTQDQDLQDMLLRWEDYLSVNEPFMVEDYRNTLGKSGYGLPLSIKGIGVPITPFMELPLALTKMSVDDVPQFSEFQGMVETLFLPIVEESISSLELLDDDQDFLFTISAALQGESEADPIELDLTEVYVLEAGLYALKGVLKTVVAYNFDFVSFDSLGIVTELSQGSDFATLKSNGAADLSLALASMNTAFDKVFDALDFLEAEDANSQDYDLITFSEDDDPDEIRADLAEIQSALQGPTLIHFSYWEDVYDNDGYYLYEEEHEDSLKIDISQFFNNPITDFKAMVPPYTMGTQMYYDYEYQYLQIPVSFTSSSVRVSGLDNSPISVTLAYYEGEPLIAFVQIGFFGYNLTTASPSDVPVAVWEAYAAFLTLVDQYSDELYQYPSIQFQWNGTATTDAQLQIDGTVYLEYEQRMASYVEPHPTWDDATYSAWLNNWPDPTMNGIFPDMDAQGIADFLDFQQEDWDEMQN